MDVNIHNIKNNKEQTLKLDTVVLPTVYFAKDKITSTIQTKDSLAYKTTENGVEQYFIYGSKDGHFYNPWETGLKRNYEWLNVRQKAFDNYVAFLNNNRQVYLTSAEQAYIYG